MALIECAISRALDMGGAPGLAASPFQAPGTRGQSATDASASWTELMDTYCEGGPGSRQDHAQRDGRARFSSKKLKQVLSVDVADVRSRHSGTTPKAAPCRELSVYARDAPRHGTRQTDTSKVSISQCQHGRRSQVHRHAATVGISPLSQLSSPAPLSRAHAATARAAHTHVTAAPTAMQPQRQQQQQDQQQQDQQPQQQEAQHKHEQQQPEASVSDFCEASWVFPQYGGRQVLSDYEFGMQLGRGSFGTTALVMHRRTATPWACKTISKGAVPSRRKLRELRNEVAVLQHLAGVAGVVQLAPAGVYEDARSVHLVMELCTGGELLADLRRRAGRYCERQAAAAVRSILTTLRRCHAAGVMHRDIKPENFLLVAPPCSGTGCAQPCCSASAGVCSCCSGPSSKQSCCSGAPLLKATDFGSATFFTEGQVFSEVVGTAAYVAPEVLTGAYGMECDVWSAGVVLYLLLSGRLPFDGASDRQVMQAVLEDELDTSSGVWEEVSEAAKAVVRLMLCKDPRQRPSANELLQHVWLQQEQASEAPQQADQQQADQQQQQPQGQAHQQQQQRQQQQLKQADQQQHRLPSSATSKAAGQRPLVHMHAAAVQCRNM